MRFSRAVRVMAHVSVAACVAPVWSLLPRREALLSWWCRRMLALMGVTVRFHGRPYRGPALVVANHVSWLDIVVLNAAVPARFIAKSEVRGWPLVGWLAARAGTIFMRRGSGPQAARAVDKAVARLKAGESVAAFPEGTSTGGTDVLGFYPAVFEAAVRSGRPVQAVALKYRCAEAPFVGDDEFLSHLWRLLGRRPWLAEVTFCPALSVRGRDRRVPAEAARGRVLAALGRRVVELRRPPLAAVL